MFPVYLVYKTDSQLSYASRDIIGIATEKQYAIDIVYAQVEKEHETLDGNQKHNLKNIFQTQGYSGEGEFQIEKVETNKLL